MIFGHPSRDRLIAWLNGDEDQARELDDHLATCQRCATVLEAITEDVEASALTDALSQVLVAPAGLGDRLERRVLDRLSSRELMGLLAELFGAGVETGRLLIVDPPARADS